MDRSDIFRIRRGAPLPSPAHADADEEQLSVMQLSEKQHRQQMAQVKASRDSTDTEFDVIEVFSPPRFAFRGRRDGFQDTFGRSV